MYGAARWERHDDISTVRARRRGSLSRGRCSRCWSAAPRARSGARRRPARHPPARATATAPRRTRRPTWPRARRRAAARADPQRRPEQALRPARQELRADHAGRPVHRARPGLLVRAQVPRPAHGQRRGLQHVRDDGGAPDAADPELRAHPQPGQRARDRGARQRPRAVPRRAASSTSATPPRSSSTCCAAWRRSSCSASRSTRSAPARGGAAARPSRAAPRRRRPQTAPRAATPPRRLPHRDAVATPAAACPPPTVAARTSPAADAPDARAFTVPARGFWVQLGAFRARDGAEGFQRRVAAELDWLVAVAGGVRRRADVPPAGRPLPAPRRGPQRGRAGARRAAAGAGDRRTALRMRALQGRRIRPTRKCAAAGFTPRAAAQKNRFMGSERQHP